MAGAAQTNAYRAMLPSLVEARHKAGLSQAALAKKLGKPPSFVGKYEIGERRIDLIETLQILLALDANIDDFIAAVINEIDRT